MQVGGRPGGLCRVTGLKTTPNGGVNDTCNDSYLFALCLKDNHLLCPVHFHFKYVVCVFMLLYMEPQECVCVCVCV